MWLAVDELSVAGAAEHALQSAEASALVDLAAVAVAVAAAMPGSRSAPRAALLVEVLQQEAASLSVGLAAHAADLASASRDYAEAEAWATSLTHGGSLPDVVTAGLAQ